MTPVRALAAAVLLAGLASCGDDSSTSSSASTTAAPATSAPATTAAAAPTTAAAAGSVPQVKDFTFPPLAAKAGATVTVANADAEDHTLNAFDGSFGVGLPAKGTATFTAPAKPGTYAFTCNIHQGMNGTLVVG